MTKQEKIQEAYGDYYVEAKDWINKNGFFNGEASHLKKLRTNLYRDNNIDITIIDEVQFVRPKSLQGIENNNDWIKIESEDDLPKLNIRNYGRVGLDDVWSRRIDGFISVIRINDLTHDNYSHWQPIIKPQPPIY